MAFSFSSFNLTHTFLNPNPSRSELFGHSVAISGKNLLISSVGSDEEELDGTASLEAAYLFDAQTGESSAIFLNPASISGQSSGDQFGFAVAIDTNQVLIGAPMNDTGAANTGAAYLFDAQTDELQQTFLNPTPDIVDEFGYALDISNNQVLIGAPLDDTGASNTGAAYLFDAETGELQQTFLNPTPGAGDMFASAVAIDENHVLIGSFLDDTGASNAGAAYLFAIETGELQQTFLNPNPEVGDVFGSSVAVSGNLVLIGARGDDIGEENSGAAYLFDAETGELLQTFFNPTPALGDVFGISVALDDGKALISASAADDEQENSGAAYLFDAETGELLETFANPTSAEGDLFGNTVAMEGGNVVIGAFGDDTEESSGAAYLFQSEVELEDEQESGSNSGHEQAILYISTIDDVIINDTEFQEEDILAYNTSTQTWSLFFDGSEAGLIHPGINLDAFHIDADGSILFSVNKATILPGVGTISAADIVRFIPSQAGDNTSGSYELYLDAGAVGLTGENIDAISFTPDNQLVISTSNFWRLSRNTFGQDEDLFAFTDDNVDELNSGTWSLYFDGSNWDLDTSKNEDVTGIDLDSEGNIYFTTKGAFEIPNLDGGGADIFTCNNIDDTCIFAEFGNGLEFGLGGQGIDGFFLG